MKAIRTHDAAAAAGRRQTEADSRARTSVGFAVAAALYGVTALRVGPVLADDETAVGNTLQEVVVTARKSAAENLQGRA